MGENRGRLARGAGAGSFAKRGKNFPRAERAGARQMAHEARSESADAGSALRERNDEAQRRVRGGEAAHLVIHESGGLAGADDIDVFDRGGRAFA